MANQRMFDDEPTLPWIGQYILGGEDGHTPIPCYNFDQWGRWMSEADRRVAFTGNDRKHVSTVFIGLDHRYFGDGPPLLFETMVFMRQGRMIDFGWGPEEARDDLYQERYSTWEEPEAAHQRAVEKWLINAETRANVGSE